MVSAVVFNKQGNDENFSKPCFGFLGYINQWSETEEWDDDEDDYVPGELEGFTSSNLKRVVWHSSSSGCDGRSQIWDELPDIMAAFPQFFSNFSILKVGEKLEDAPNYTIRANDIAFTLEGQNMQTTVMGAMMLRNLLEYASFGNSYHQMRTWGYDIKFSFIMSMTYQCNQSFGSNSYSFWQGTGGDESIFSDDAAIADLKNILEGGIGFVYQGNFGDTENGYGRNGEYDDKNAPHNPRTEEFANLHDVMMLPSLKDLPEDWPVDTLWEVNGTFSPNRRFDSTQMQELTKHIYDSIYKL